MRKTIKRLALTALALATLCVSAFAFTAEEKELIQAAEEKGYLDYLYVQDLDEANRLDIAKLMAAFMHLDVTDSDTTDFADLEGYSPQEKGVVNAVSSLGLMAGMGEGIFVPDAEVTQAQAALILYRAMGSPEGVIQGQMWAVQVEKAMKNLGIIEEMETTAPITKKLFLEWMLNAPVETKYFFEMKVEANNIRVRISAPATEDPNEEYDIFAWDPDQMNMGRVGTWIKPGQWIGLPTAPFSGTLRKMILVRRSDGIEVANWTLDKPIITDNSLEAPEDVTIYRSKAFEGQELYVFRGVDTGGGYHYLMESPGGGGRGLFNMAGFQMAAGRFGSEMRLSVMDAWETDAAFYTNISPKVIVPITDTDGKNGYELEWGVAKNQVAAQLTRVPSWGADEEYYNIYCYSFDDPKSGSLGSGGAKLDQTVYMPYASWNTTIDVVEICRGSDDTAVAMWRMEKPIVANRSLPAPEGVTVTRKSLNDKEEVLRFTGLDLDNYYYDLRNSEGRNLRILRDEEITVATGRYGSEVRLGMGQVSEDDDAFYTEYSDWAILNVGTAGEDSGSGEYSVELAVMGDRWISARLIAPADTDPDAKYRLYFWDSAQPELGRISCGQRPSDGHNGILTPHWNCTLDTVLLEDNFGNELGQWTLEKPIICEESLPAPQNVTIRRSAAANEKELFVFEGLDPNQKCYLMEHTEEDVPAVPFTGNSFEAKAGRYGSEVLLRAEKAWETDDAFRAIVSPKVRVAVTDTDDSDVSYAVTNLRLDGTRVRWDTPNSNGKRIGYVVYLYSTQEQDWVRFGSIHDANKDSMRLATEQEPIGGRYTALRVVTEELGTPDDVILGEAEISVDMGFIIAPRREPTAKLEWTVTADKYGMKGWEIRLSGLTPNADGDIAFRNIRGNGPTLGYNSDENGNAVLFCDFEDLEECLKEGYFMVVEYNIFAIGVNELYYDWVADARWTPCSENAKDFAAKSIFYGDGMLSWYGEQLGGLEYTIYVDGNFEERTESTRVKLMLTGTHEIRIVTVLDGTAIGETVQTIVAANGEEDYNVEGVVVNGAGATVSGGGAAATVNADGSFCFEVLEGTFDVTVKKAGCLTYTVKNVTPNGRDVDLGTIKLLAGDTNNDGMINIMDMGIFRQNFGKTGENIANAYTDTNGDKMVNILDMSTFRTNFGKTAANNCTVEYGAA